jgi:hypothetical protein
MSNAGIILSIIGGTLVLAAVFYLSNYYEDQKRKKILLINQLNQQSLTLLNFLDYIPARYLHKDLVQLLLSENFQICQRLFQMTQNDKHHKRLNTLQGMIEQSSSGKPVNQLKKLTKPNETKAALECFKTLAHKVEKMHVRKLISASQARTFLTPMHLGLIEVKIEGFIASANVASQGEKPKLALSHFYSAMKELEKHPDDNYKHDIAKSLRAQIDEIESNLEETIAAEGGDDSRLDQGVDHLLDEDENWKKKYF